MSDTPTNKLPPAPHASRETQVANALQRLANAVRQGRVDADRAARIVEQIGGGGE